MAKPRTTTIAVELDAHEHRMLERTWGAPAGVLGWLSEVNHRSIGKRFIVTAFAFFLLGGILALLMRLQLAHPESRLLRPDLYNQIFTMHGTTIMFLFAVPMMEGMGVYLVPLMVGTRNIAFPRLNAFTRSSSFFRLTALACSAGPPPPATSHTGWAQAAPVDAG